MNYRPRRSALYIPASNSRALEKSKNLAADAFIYDLEDSVAPDQKSEARNQIYKFILENPKDIREKIIRINAFDTDWGKKDLEALVNLEVNAILLPKVQSKADIESIYQYLDQKNCNTNLKVWAMMETPMAVLNAGEISSMAHEQSKRLECLVLGTNDLSKETGARIIENRQPVLSWLSTCVLAAKAYKIDILDSVFNNFEDSEGLRSECEDSRDMGMDGKTVIHPDQISIANEVFLPLPDEVEWSEKIIQHFSKPENDNKGAISIDGKLVERLHKDMAEQTIKKVEAIKQLKNN